MSTVNEQKLRQLIAQVKEVISKLSPKEKAAMDRETAIEFAYNNLVCTGRRPYITRELIERLYDERMAAKKDLSED